jgi:hypothetical protein
MNYDKSASFLAAQLSLKITQLKRRIKNIRWAHTAVKIEHAIQT